MVPCPFKVNVYFKYSDTAHHSFHYPYTSCPGSASISKMAYFINESHVVSEVKMSATDDLVAVVCCRRSASGLQLDHEAVAEEIERFTTLPGEALDSHCGRLLSQMSNAKVNDTVTLGFCSFLMYP